MQQSKAIIVLSDHVKKKIKSQQVSLPSSLSTQSNLSDDHSVPLSLPKLLHRRSSTFVIYQVRQPSDSKPFFTEQRLQSCEECLGREELLQKERECVIRTNEMNRKLSKQLRTSLLLNRQYEEENCQLKEHLTRLTWYLQEYQMHFQLLKEQISSEKKHHIKDEQFTQLRHELDVYNQVILAKHEEERKPIGYFIPLRKTRHYQRFWDSIDVLFVVLFVDLP